MNTYLVQPHVVDDVAPADGVGLHVLRHELDKLERDSIQSRKLSQK